MAEEVESAILNVELYQYQPTATESDAATAADCSDIDEYDMN